MFRYSQTVLPMILVAAVAGLFGCGSSPRNAPETELPRVMLREAALIQFRGVNSASSDKPGECDCNNPAHWDGDALYVFNSAGHPWRSAGPDLFHLQTNYARCEYDNTASGGRWIECTWKVEDGTLYGWYHFEPTGICPGAHPDSPKMNLTAPRIGAVKSADNGATWHDLGLVLETPADALKCDTKNYYFAGGNGDFSVMLDAKKEFLHFFFSTYPSLVSEQGFAVARMRWADRDRPVGKVWKWHEGKWNEPGLGGRVSPIFPAKVDWHRADADAFWGPSIHWNTHLRQYVILLNRAKDGHFTQEGIYVTFNRDLSNPSGWSPPQRIPLSQEHLAWYPQVVGLDRSRHETDKLAGRVARLFVRGQSRWEIIFLQPGERE
jgi:hypothetical protein